MSELNPYLTFDSNCEEAFEFYRSVFGGEFTSIGRFGDVDFGMEMEESERSKIMHVVLPIGNGSSLMGSDSPSAMGSVTAGTNVSIALNPDTEEETRRIFEALSVGGTVTMPMDIAPWGALFGMLNDKFGFAWLINYDVPPAEFD